MDSPTSFLLVGFIAGALFVAWLIRHVLQPVARERDSVRSAKRLAMLFARLARLADVDRRGDTASPREFEHDSRLSVERLEQEAARAALDAPRFSDAKRSRATRRAPKKNRR